MPRPKRVAIIGAGVSGIAAIKSCVEEGLDPVCFERLDDIGGIWLTRTFGKNVPEFVKARMFNCVHFNTSKEMSCFSDFPMPKEYPTFPTAMQGLEYYRSYVDHFDIRRYIQFKTEVKKLQRTKDFEETGRWKLTYKLLDEGDQQEDIFDCVLVCKGVFQQQHWPHYEGLDTFQGGKTHSGNYIDNTPYHGKTVLVIGSSASAGDISCDVGLVAKQTYISTRSGLWIIPRLIDDRTPFDYFLRDYFTTLFVPPKIVERNFERRLLARIDYEKYSAMPQRNLFSMSLLVSDVMHSRLLLGQLKVMPDVSSFTQTGVKFTDGSSVDIDEVIFSTGFNNSCSFIDDEDIYPASGKPEDTQLYKYIFPVNVSKTTIAFIGDMYVFGGYLPVVELQARYAVQVFKGNVRLPSKQKMSADVVKFHKAVKKIRGASAYKVLPHKYQLDIAAQFGASPPFFKLFLTDPKLAWRCLMGGDVTAVYRLRGPGAKYDLARQMIMSAQENMIYPYKNKSQSKSEKLGNDSHAWRWARLFILSSLMAVSLAIPSWWYMQRLRV